MPKKEPKRTGRPPATNPKNIQWRLRVDKALADAVEVYRVRNHLGDTSDAVRHAVARTLAAEGLLK
jgi:hypothetical protein